MSDVLDRPRTYEVRTFGCQMNVHDSERLSGSLEAAGYVRAVGGEADVVVINTCAVRENADNKLYGNLGILGNAKRSTRGMQIAVGGCLAQKDKATILEKAPWVDVVFGTHNMGSLPTPARTCAAQRRGAARDPRVARGVPLHAADPSASRRYSGVGVDLRRLQQHLHVLHRARAARQGEGPPSRRHPRRDPGARRRRRDRGDAARPERELLRRRVRRPAGVRQAAARRRPHRGPRAHPLHEPAPRRVHRRRHRRHGRDPRRDAAAAHAAAVGFRPHPQGDASLVPLGEVPRHPRPGARSHPARGDHAPTSSWASPARPRRTSRRPCVSSSGRGSPRRSPSSTRSARAPPPRRWRTRCRRPSCRSATSASSALQDRISLRGEPEARRPHVEVLVTAAEGRKDAATHRLSGRARGQPARALRGAGRHRQAPPRRHRDGRRSRRPRPSTSSPTRSTAPRSRAAHARRRRVGSRRGGVLRACPRRGDDRRPGLARAARARAWRPCRSTTRATAPLARDDQRRARRHRRRDRHRQVRALARPRRAPHRHRPDRRDRQRRRDAALPGHGHRHREAARERAPRHPASPARRARRPSDEASVAALPGGCPRGHRGHRGSRRPCRSSSAAPASTSRA